MEKSKNRKKVKAILKTSFQMNGAYLQVFVLDELYSEIIQEIQKKNAGCGEEKRA